MKFNSLGSNIKKYRNKIGLTQKELGEKILKSEISIRKYESGKINIPFSTLCKLCEIFKISLRTLLGDDVNLYIENNPQKDLLKTFFLQDTVVNKQQKTISKLYSSTNELFEYGKSWGDEHLRITTTPEGLLETILNYLRNNDLYYTAMNFPEVDNPNNPELPYFKKNQIKAIIEKVCNLVINEVDKIEDFNYSIYNQTMKITKYILENNNVEFNKKTFEELYEKLNNAE